MIGCRQKSELYYSLEAIDSLMYIYEVDEAKKAIKSIDSTMLGSDREKAYYNFLYARLFCGPNSNVLNEALDYYYDVDDVEGIAYCLLYKANSYSSYKDDSASWFFREAEYYAYQTKNRRLRYLVNWGLGRINNSLGDVGLALKYYKRQFDEACYLRDMEHDIALLDCASASISLQRKDSAWFYISQIINPDAFPESIKPFYYNYKGELLLDRDTILALECFEKSVGYRYWELSYKNLSELYYALGRVDDAERLISRVMDSSCYEIRIEVMDMFIKDAIRDRDLDKLVDCYGEKCLLLDSLMERNAKYRVFESQKECEEYIADMEFRILILRSLIGLIVVVIVIVGVVLYRRYENVKLEMELAERGAMISNLQSEISGLELRNSSNDDINVVKERLDALLSDSVEGGKLLELVQKNNCTLAWSKYDIDTLIEYYSSITPAFKKEVEMMPDCLTGNERFFLLLESLNKTDAQMSRILGISEVSVRVKRSRMRKKCQE